jgi:hypothetical protein
MVRSGKGPLRRDDDPSDALEQFLEGIPPEILSPEVAEVMRHHVRHPDEPMGNLSFNDIWRIVEEQRRQMGG